MGKALSLTPRACVESCEVTLDLGKDATDDLFASSTWPLIRYDRGDAAAEPTNSTGQYAYYRRLSSVPAEFSLYDLVTDEWHVGEDNAQDVDWRIFSTETDALDDTNPWADCDVTQVVNRGFPGECGPIALTPNQWASKSVGIAHLRSC